MERDIRLDALRGLVLAWMTINHLSGPLHAYSFETLGFVSSAEGFVFISGIVAGMVYGRIGLNPRHRLASQERPFAGSSISICFIWLLFLLL